MKLSMFLVAAYSLIATAAAGAHLRGMVDYSFDDRFRILRTDDYVYLMNAAALSAADRRSLEQVGSLAAIDLSTGAVVRAWSAKAPPGSMPAPQRPDSVSAEGRYLRFTGVALPATTDAYRYVQVKSTIFRLDASKLPATVRRKLDSASSRVSLRVLKSAVRFAWTSTPKDGRFLASLQRTDRAPDGYDVFGEEVRIRGEVLSSSDDDQVLLQSGDTFFAILRAALDPGSRGASPAPGNHVIVSVPAAKIALVWVQNDAALPDALLSALEPKKE